MVYAALLGVTLSSIFLVYTGASITRVFFISAASFGALSCGATPRSAISPAMGSFLFMGLFGLIIATLVNIFLKSSGLDFIISAAGVLIFAGPHRLGHPEDQGDVRRRRTTATSAGRKAVMGALSLYLDFINLFLMLLRLVGDRR